MTANVISLNIKPGIQRDGTEFDAPCYVNGQWVRFQRGRPRKMGGYKGIFQNASGISRGMIMSSDNHCFFRCYSDTLQSRRRHRIYQWHVYQCPADWWIWHRCCCHHPSHRHSGDLMHFGRQRSGLYSRRYPQRCGRIDWRDWFWLFCHSCNSYDRLYIEYQ